MKHSSSLPLCINCNRFHSSTSNHPNYRISNRFDYILKQPDSNISNQQKIIQSPIVMNQRVQNKQKGCCGQQYRQNIQKNKGVYKNVNDLNVNKGYQQRIRRGVRGEVQLQKEQEKYSNDMCWSGKSNNETDFRDKQSLNSRIQPNSTKINQYNYERYISNHTKYMNKKVVINPSIYVDTKSYEQFTQNNCKVTCCSPHSQQYQNLPNHLQTITKLKKNPIQNINSLSKQYPQGTHKVISLIPSTQSFDQPSQPRYNPIKKLKNPISLNINSQNNLNKQNKKTSSTLQYAKNQQLFYPEVQQKIFLQTSVQQIQQIQQKMMRENNVRESYPELFKKQYQSLELKSIKSQQKWNRVNGRTGMQIMENFKKDRLKKQFGRYSRQTYNKNTKLKKINKKNKD